jgi:hypothetical protein
MPNPNVLAQIEAALRSNGYTKRDEALDAAYVEITELSMMAANLLSANRILFEENKRLREERSRMQ